MKSKKLAITAAMGFKATERVTRDVGYLSQESNWLLYHELGHASDFMPVSARATLDSAASAWINISRVASRPSDRLDTLYRLTSSEMKALAEIKFITGPVSDGTLVNGIPYSTLKTYTPAQVGGFFAPDLATDEYNYSTIREDLTMTFEEVMMSRNHNWRRDVAMTDKATPTSKSETLIVRWGQRGRIGEAAIRPRAQFVVSEIAPWLDAAAVVGALPAPIAMRPGESWKANLVVPAPPGGMASAMAFNGMKLTTEEDQILLRRALSRQLIGVSGPSMAHWAPNPLEPDLRATGSVRQALRVIDGGRPADVMGELVLELGDERGILAIARLALLQLVERADQRLGDENAAVGAEVAARVGKVVA